MQSILTRTIFTIVFLLIGNISAFADDCLYQAAKEARPLGMKSRVQSEFATSYLLRNGVYLSVVSWNCRRIGKRVLIVVPESERIKIDTFGIFESVVGKEIAKSFKKSFDAAGKQQEFSEQIEIDGMESAEFSSRSNFYEQVFTIIYATPD